jgi:hypothetical protein
MRSGLSDLGRVAARFAEDVQCFELRDMGLAADSEMKARYWDNYIDSRTTPSVGLLHSTEECNSCYEGFPSESFSATPFPQHHCPIVWRTWSGSERRSKNVLIACAVTKSSFGKLSCSSDPLQLQSGNILQPFFRFTLPVNGPRTTTSSFN